MLPLFLLSVTTVLLAAPPPSAEEQIAVASMAAPKEHRAAVTVLGYNAEGKLTTLRSGTNELICLADNPAIEGIEVDCYHKDLEPFMARGRELAAQGVKGMDRHKQRWKEVDEGKLKLPKEPRMLYVLTGKSYDAASGTIVESYLRWVVYTPYATPESTGLSTKSSNEPVADVPRDGWCSYHDQPAESQAIRKAAQSANSCPMGPCRNAVRLSGMH